MSAAVTPAPPEPDRTLSIAPTRAFTDVDRSDVASGGGKGANLGELTRAGFPVPPGFIITIDAYRRAHEADDLLDRIAGLLAGLHLDDPASLAGVSASIRELVLHLEPPADVREAILHAYRELGGDAAPLVAVRSSAAAEDTGQFSFAGMFESFLGVRGDAALLDAVRACWASTFGARVLYYRLSQGMLAEMPVAVIVQRMIDSTKSGVIFTADPATHDRSRLVIEAAWGLGEVVVGGQVTPDRYVLDKATLAVLERAVAKKAFMLTRDRRTGVVTRLDLVGHPRESVAVLGDAELSALGALANRVEDHYRAPQDIEFAIDDAGIHLTQSRPITTLAVRATAEGASIPVAVDHPLVRGLGASPGEATGPVRALVSPADAVRLTDGDVLVTHITSPDWTPLMRRAAAIVTDAGGVTSHAAIVSRELGIPCVVGTTNATKALADGVVVTVNGTRGTVTPGAPASRSGPATSRLEPAASAAPRTTAPAPATATRLYVNLATTDRIDEIARMPVDGVGLLRAEVMLLDALENTHPRRLLAERRSAEFVQRMADRMTVFARAFSPRPVIYRATDFRSNEFRQLAGGEEYEPHEENPMIGYRGAFRYTREPDLFALELEALHRARTEHRNLHLMLPFVRTGWEMRACRKLIDESPLAGCGDLDLWIMAEVPSVVHWLPEYVRLGVTGVSIGSNDLTQLVLGVDRDGERLAPYFDERDPAVLDLIHAIIREAHRLGLPCSICGQAPSVYPDYVERLVRWGIDSISVNPDAIESARRQVAAAELRLLLDAARGESDERAAALQHDEGRTP